MSDTTNEKKKLETPQEIAVAKWETKMGHARDRVGFHALFASLALAGLLIRCSRFTADVTERGFDLLGDGSQNVIACALFAWFTMKLAKAYMNYSEIRTEKP
jgi:hypothetical protein